MARILHIDLETYSSVDIGKAGLYRYAQSPDFEILLFAYSFGDEDEVHVVDLTVTGALPHCRKTSSSHWTTPTRNYGHTMPLLSGTACRDTCIANRQAGRTGGVARWCTACT